MNPNIRIKLLSPVHGERLIRLEDDATGLSVERKLKPDAPLVTQKAKLMRLFEAFIQTELALA